MKLKASARRRVGISELVGSVLSLAITVIAGAAVFGYVNIQAGLSELSYASSVAATNNFLAEDFKVFDLHFPSTTQAAYWIYNVGNVNLQVFQVRLYDNAGQINILYNYTVAGGTKTDYLYDLRSSLATKCGTAASSYESPTITSLSVKTTNARTLSLTIPPTQTNCPSFGQSYTAGTTYTVVVTGLYGNSVSTYQKK